MALHAVPPSSKAKREQARRNFLARRRSSLTPRVAETKSSLTTAKTPRSIANVSKDPLDMLEAQETRHGVYVTAPAGDQTSIVVDDDEDIESQSGKFNKSHETVTAVNDTTANSRKESSTVKNSARILNDTVRRKNTVSMPESLYNHFRPVESNVPMEDMSQFLYFGQKIHPENTTSNNSVEVTSASPPSHNSRRRFFLKNPSTTSLPKLEEIINEEMNIALEKSTVEKNKIPKSKNTFRSTNLYTRKQAALQVRASDPTIASNVIVTNRSSDPSAHAADQMEDHLTGSPTTHHINVSTQIPGDHQRNDVGGRGNESEIANSNVVTISTHEDYQSDSTLAPIKSADKPTANILQRKKNHSVASRIDRVIEETNSTKDQRPAIKTFESITREESTTTTALDDKSPSRISTLLSINSESTSTTSESALINKVTTIIPPTTINLSHQQHHTSLRIVVTEPAVMAQDQNYQTTVSTRNSSMETLSTTVSIIPTMTTRYFSASTTPAMPLSTSDTPAVQQMHPYAYTITNVTRLLGNYSGPGSNDRTTTTEAFPPLSTAAAADAGALEVLESARTPDPVSVSPTAAESTASSSPFVVGERGRKGTSLRIESVDLDSPTTLSTTYYYINDTIVKPLRWNSTQINGKIDKDIVNERRYLRKSASAVLNQRVGDESIREYKRRRTDTSSRRAKGPRGEDRVSGSRSIDEHGLIELSNKTVNIDTMGKSVDNTTLSSVTMSDETKKIDELKSQNNSMINDDDSLNFTTNVSNMDTSTVKSASKLVTETTTRPLTTIKTVTTRPAPVFPVTPIMLDSTNKVTKEEENHDSAGPKIPDRPFGIAKDLDPSEIQKMYRAQATLKPETITTPTEVTTSQPKMDASRRPASGERSPEVRGRNLSDKTKDKDKDDVLPIMHLYNTSDIFNGTKDQDTLGVAVKPKVVADTTGFQEVGKNISEDTRSDRRDQVPDATEGRTSAAKSHNNNNSNNNNMNKNRQDVFREGNVSTTSVNRTRQRPPIYNPGPPDSGAYHPEVNRTLFEPGMISVSPRESINISEVITKRHDGDTLATQETVAVVSYILATLVVFPIAVGVGLILRRLIIRNRKVLEESDTSSEISCRKDALNLENGDFKTSIEKAITKLPRIQHLCHEAEKPPPPTTQESRWEFPRDKLRLQTVLGQGNFGQVWKAEADDLTGHKGTTRLVAVKTVKEGASAREKEDLVRELEIMQQLGNHPNVVTLLGCCTEEEPHYLILEYVMYGKLLAYLRDHRTRQDFYNFSEDSAALTSRDLTVFGYCVARGMEYLASKKIIHRDLAARNVLVDHNKLCKIADYGMSRFANEEGECIETRHGRNALPIRWMAPESLIYSLFTTKTDVWSFGILMWEIVTLGSTPYPDMAAREVMRNVQDGYRLERPSHCRSELFRVIARCWHADPDRRPEFQTLRRDLAQLLEDNMNGHYVDLESFASECND